MIDLHSWRALAVNVMMHVYSGANSDNSARPKTNEPFNIQSGFEILVLRGVCFLSRLAFVRFSSPGLVLDF
jgi:hypothetical protein